MDFRGSSAGQSNALVRRRSQVRSLPPEHVVNKAEHKKASFIGAPAIFALEIACKTINDAFGGFGCYVVGSALERPDWRDVDVRMILSDEEFMVLFPAVNLEAHNWEFDPRWTLLTVSVSMWLRKVTGLPVDFQFQPQTHANKRHPGQRCPTGLKMAKGM